MIARFLKRQGVNPFIRDLQPEVEIRMYDSLRDGWAGFRKNSSLMGGGPLGFVMILSIFAGIFLVFPALWWPGIVAVYIAKFASDRFCGFSLMTTVLAPLSFVLAIMITVDSAWGHLSGNVTWKGRKVSRRS